MHASGKMLVLVVLILSAGLLQAGEGNGLPPASVPALGNWGLVLMIGVLGGVLARWLLGRRK